jgi:hypothetical protein
MAINFLNTVDFNKNQLNFARIQNLGTDPSTANSSIGQIYFNTTADTLKQYVANAGSGAAGWVEVGSTSVKAGTGIGVTFAAGEATVRNTGLVTVLDGTYINLSKQGGGDNTQLTADLSAINGTSDSTTRFLSKDNTWDIVDGATVGKATASVLGTVELFSNTVQTVAANAVTTTASRTYGVQFNSNDQMVVNVPWTDTNVVTYDLTTAPTGTAIRLTGSNSTNDDVTISGFSGQTTMTRISGTELRVALTPTVTIANNLTLTNGAFTQTAGGENNLNANLDMNSNKLLKIANGTDATDGVNLGQVEALVAGIGLFKGGYNATTGLTINLTSNGSLDGASNIALDQGDFFVVTTAGTAFYGVTLEVGDMIYANVGIAANSNPAQTVYTVVIQDANIAGAGATDGATQKGVAGFDSANFTVSGTGWVQLKEEVLSGRMAKVTLTGGDNSVAGETTFTVSLTTLFGSGAAADDAIATVKEEASNLIVYPEVTGNGTGSLDFVFMPQVGNGDYRAIISIV